jgi:hypothetical protein
MLLPGVQLNTSASDYYPIKQLRLQRYDGRTWVPLGDMIDDSQPQPSVRAVQRENIGKP